MKIEIRECQRPNKSSCVRFDVLLRYVSIITCNSRVALWNDRTRSIDTGWTGLKTREEKRKSGLVFRYYHSMKTVPDRLWERLVINCSIQLVLFSRRIMHINGEITGSNYRNTLLVLLIVLWILKTLFNNFLVSTKKGIKSKKQVSYVSNYVSKYLDKRLLTCNTTFYERNFEWERNLYRIYSFFYLPTFLFIYLFLLSSPFIYFLRLL